jgi:methylenetetrahydrofolate dehydrogenase (NADP+)/methenyltetrahydrofolate cyclohydrolase
MDGRALARKLELELAGRVRALAARAGGAPPPRLAILLVGASRTAARYAERKVEACRRTGMAASLAALPDRAPTAAVLAELDRLNRDPRVHGVFLQYPLPGHVDERRCFDGIAVDKDVDGVSTLSCGRLALGETAFAAATAAGILFLLAHHGIAVAGRAALVVGDGAAVGRPIAMLLLRADATVTACRADAPDLERLVRGAAVVVGAAGRPELIRGAWIADGAVVIDTGYHPGGRGDVELPPAAAGRCLAYTPVPGGTGPMTIAALLDHTVTAAERAWKEIASRRAAGDPGEA